MTTGKKAKVKLAVLWIVSIVIALVIITGILGYFYWGRLIRKTLTEAVIAETKGLYSAEIDWVYFNIISGNVHLRDVSLAFDPDVYKVMSDSGTAPSVVFNLDFSSFRIKDFSLRKALISHRINIENIDFREPHLDIFMMKKKDADTPNTKNKAGRQNDTSLSLPLPKGWLEISVGKILLRKGRFTLNDYTGDTVKRYEIPSFDILVQRLHIDTTQQADTRVFNTDDIRVVLRDVCLDTKDSMYSLNAGTFGLSTCGNRIFMENISLIPRYDRQEFSRKSGYQSDRMDIFAGLVSLNRINWEKLILNHQLIAGSLVIDSPVLDDYRDKRLPMRPGFKPPMPQQLIRNLKQYIRIDSVILVNGKATYSEQVGEEAGVIFFDRLNGILTGLTNDSLWLAENRVSELKAEAFLQGTGKLEARIGFIIGDTNNHFTVSANMSSFDLPDVNTMLSKLLPAEIKSGKVKKLEIPEIRLNDEVATGHLTLFYDDLQFRIWDEENTTWSGIKTGLLNFVGGQIMVPKSNPDQNGKLRSGIIYFERDKYKSIINFLWKSVFSGLKSNMGFNTKEQRVIKKAEKHAD